MGVRKLHMRQSYKIIPIYTADVSGVCSALYDLGGMVVMHDPSGCNSTYNTHDEIRWYDQDSLIYISGLTEIDAVMGNDAKFIHDIEEAERTKTEVHRTCRLADPIYERDRFSCNRAGDRNRDRNPGFCSSDKWHA